MKTAFTLVSLLFSNLLFCQNTFTRQLNGIISDTTNHFQKFKGKLQEFAVPDSFNCYSTIILEGTKENRIYTNRTICTYEADIVDSVKKSNGKKILSEWKLILMTALGSGYKIQENKTRMMNSKIVDGWYFDNGNLTISLHLFQSIWDKSLYGVGLSITNFHPVK